MTNILYTQQTEMIKAFDVALRNNRLVAVIDHRGSGFKYSLNVFSLTYPMLKTVLITFNRGQFKVNDLSIDIARGFSSIRFSNMKYKNADPVDLIKAIGARVKADLKGRNVLLVFERFENLATVNRMARFMGIIKSINFKCGIVVRTTTSHINKIENTNEDFYYELMQFFANRQSIKPYEPEDIEIFCKSFGMVSPTLLDETKIKCKNLTQAKESINLFLKYNPIKQLNLDFSRVEPEPVRFS